MIKEMVKLLRETCKRTKCTTECPYAYAEKEGGEKYFCRLALPRGVGCPGCWNPSDPELKWR